MVPTKVTASTDMTQRNESARAVWNRNADSDPYYTIWSDPTTKNPKTAVAAFAESGRVKARYLAWFVNPEASVVELGCGMGRILKPLAASCGEVIGVDISERMLELAVVYTAGIDNLRLEQTDGASLGMIDDSSVDFFYSLDVLIHVDRRSAFRYLREIRRVLKPGAIAVVNFLDIASSRGFGEFEALLDSDFPLELYTVEELRFLFARAGLEIDSEQQADGTILLIVVHGSASQWRDALGAATSIEGVTWAGRFSEQSAGDQGAVSAQLRNAGDRWLTCRVHAVLERSSDGAELTYAEGVVATPPNSSVELSITFDGSMLRIEFDGQEAGHPLGRGSAKDQVGEARLRLAVLPSGQQPSAEMQRVLPGLFASRTVTLS